MVNSWRHRLEKLIAERRLSLKPVSVAAGLSETFLRDVLKRGADPGVESLLRVCDILHIPASHLFDGGPMPTVAIPIVGEASGGEKWAPFDDEETADELIFTLDDADPIAIRVRGNSMSPVYRNGDYLICSRKRGADIARALHKDCVVRTSNGEYYVKHILKGTRSKTYRLRSYDPAYPDLEDQVLDWAAPIVWVHRG